MREASRLRKTAALALAVLGLALAALYLRSAPYELPDGIRQPILALELARSPAEVHTVLDNSRAPPRSALKTKVNGDFPFIVIYSGIFLLAARALSRRGARRLALLLAATTIAAGAFDVAENLGLYRLIASTPDESDAVLRPIQLVTMQLSVLKWSAVFAAALLMVPLFWPSSAAAIPERRAGRVLALLLATTGVLGGVGLVHRGLLGYAMAFTIVGLSSFTASAIAFPHWYRAPD